MARLARLLWKRDGFALVSMAIVLAVILAFGVSVLNYSLTTRRAGNMTDQTFTSLQIAEAGLHKAIFCLNATSGTNCGGSFGQNYGGESAVSFGRGNFTTTVTGGGATRTVTSAGLASSGRAQTVKVILSTSPPTSPANFDYALQAADGGVTVENNAEVRNGSVYSASSISCGNNAEMSGPVYVSKTGGIIDNCDMGGDAHADSVTNNKMNGHDVYYKTSGTGNTGVGHSYGSQATPAAAPMPTLDVPHWQSAAAAGGTIAGDSNPADNAHLGPIKITGNLTLGNNVDIIVDGPIWVLGNILLNENATFTLNSAYGANSTVIMADGTIAISNNATIYGSGHISSFIMMYTPSTDVTAAIDIANNAGGAVFYAPNGTVSISNNAAITAVAAKKVTLSQNCVIDYSNAYHDASDVLITNGFSGIWQTSPGTWRQVKP